MSKTAFQLALAAAEKEMSVVLGAGKRWQDRMSNCAQHHDYKGAIGYCPRCRIAELEAELKRRTEERDDWEGRYNALYTNGPIYRAEAEMNELQETLSVKLQQFQKLYWDGEQQLAELREGISLHKKNILRSLGESITPTQEDLDLWALQEKGAG